MIIRILLLLTLVAVLTCCAPEESTISVDEFILQEGFEIELIAAEPLLEAPLAMTFGADGSIWAVELPGYMRDIEGTDENEPDGKIIKLSDDDGDGIMDRRTVIKDGLIAPRALALVYGGLLYSNGTHLLWESLEASNQEVVLVDSLYVIGGNIEHQPNGLLYNLDNWIYSAKSNARYKRINGEWIKEATISRGQWGITQDVDGRLYSNDNSNPLYADFLPPNVAIRNPYLKIEQTMNRNIAKDRRLFAYQATMVNRGYLEDVLDDDGKVKETTSACAPLIFQSDQWGTDYKDNAFVCAPEANVVKRYILNEVEGSITAKQAYDGEEFLVSKDETFRPVNLNIGLDGNMYIVDLRKGIIQHRAYMTSYLREKILDRHFDQINGLGRIYRVKRKGVDAQDIINQELNNDRALEWLQSSIGERRLCAQKYFVEKNDLSMVQSLEDLAQNSVNGLGQVHALWTLEGMSALDQKLLITIANEAKSPSVIYQLLRLLSDQDRAIYLIKWSDISPKIDLLIGHLSGKMEDNSHWLAMAQEHRENPLFAEALISGLDTSVLTQRLTTIKKFSTDTIYSILKSTITNRAKHDWKGPKLQTQVYKDDRTAGLELYDHYCSSCHGLDGLGRGNLAPPLMNSEYISGDPERLILVLLHGLKGPIHVNGQLYEMNAMMPGIKDTPTLTDKDINDIIIFLRNSYSFANPWIDLSLVSTLREKTKDRNDVFTEAELDQWIKENVEKKNN